ncbi:MAG: hypothetical protein WBP13_12370 [Methylophilaceae bacterium]
MMKSNGILLSRIQERNNKSLKQYVALACVLLSTAAQSYEVDKKIVVTSGLEYDSNPAMSVANKDSVWTFSLLPEFKLDIKDDLNRWYVDAGLKMLRYSNEKAVANQVNPQLLVGWDRTYESGIYGVKASYQETTARNAELNNLGAFDNPDNKQTTKLIGANWQHSIAPRWTILTDGAYSDVSYSNKSLLDDYRLAGIKSKLSYENSERLTTYGLLGYSHYNSDNGNTNLARAGVGADYQLNEELTISPYLGMYNMSGRQSDTDWEGGIKAVQTTGKSLFSAAIARNVEDSGLGFRVVDSIKLGAEYSITERDRIGADYSFNQFKKDNILNVDKLDSRSLGVFYTRSISEQWLAKVYASHKELDFSDNNPKGNVIGFTFIFNTLSF